MADNSSTGVMSDFVFGGIESDDSHLLVDEREQWSGLRHRNQIDPLDPLPGQPVTITVYAGPDVAIDRLCTYVTVDGSPPRGERGVATRGHAVQLACTDLIWQPLLWDYVEVWTAMLDAQSEGTFVQYRIEGWCEEEPVSVWCSEANLDGTPARAALYGYHVDRFYAPGWAREALVYQIFVDRFSAYGQGWLEPDELDRVAGGTLRGVIEHLDYLVDLGVTVLWLSPVFRS